MSCKYCERVANRDLPTEPCGLDDLGARNNIMDGNNMVMWIWGRASGYTKINYCPMCGRKLGEEQ